MIPRYCTSEMSAIWSDENRYRVWLEIELLQAGARGVTMPDDVMAHVDWTLLRDRALIIEQTTHHDVIAFLMAVEEQLGQSARHLHFGMTSSDVVDTAFACLLQHAGKQLLARLSVLEQALLKKAQQYKYTPCLGRTHGQAAEPTSFGLKLLSFVAEFRRDKERLVGAISEIAFGKLSGAVGNYGNSDPGVEAEVLQQLGLQVEPVSTQIVPRDRHSMFFSTLAVIGGGLERLAVEIRHLMRSEVAEAFEPFGTGQRGSSAMPHKKNPILSENVTGLARLLRGYAASALENQALWHERDISHSSVERVIAPDATQVLDFALARMVRVVEGLVVDEAAMQKHIDIAGDRIYSESVLLALVNKGMQRSDAYKIVQQAALAGRGLQSDTELAKHFTGTELADLMSAKHHLRHVDAIFERLD